MPGTALKVDEAAGEVGGLPGRRDQPKSCRTVRIVPWSAPAVRARSGDAAGFPAE